MIREFNFVHLGHAHEGLSMPNQESLQTEANLFSTEFYYLAAYIQRHLRLNAALKAMKKNITKEKQVLYINFGVGFDKTHVEYIAESRVLYLKTACDYTRLNSMTPFAKRADALLSFVMDKIQLCEAYIPGMKGIMAGIVHQFKEEQYKNVWEYAKKRITGVGTAKLVCELTPVRFYLRLVVVDKNKHIIFNKQLLETLPDTLCYYQEFKTLMVNKGIITVTDRIYEKPIYTLDVEHMLIGMCDPSPLKAKRLPQWLIDFELQHQHTLQKTS